MHGMTGADSVQSRAGAEQGRDRGMGKDRAGLGWAGQRQGHWQGLDRVVTGARARARAGQENMGQCKGKLCIRQYRTQRTAGQGERHD